MRAYNFNAGPAALPFEVLQQAQAELPDFHGIGMSIMEVSHRSAEYEQVHNEAIQLLRDLLGIPNGYSVLFLQGGASQQFAMVPLNFLQQGQVACYVQTGNWSSKAYKEAKLLGAAEIITETDVRPLEAPAITNLHLPVHSAYVHATSNETIEGLSLPHFPVTGAVPLICDMSSDILARPIDVSQFAMIYAGAQKNLGPSGVTVVIIKDELLARTPASVPSMLRYDVHAKGNSLYNTPPTFAVYLMGLVLKWARDQGGLSALYERNQRKAGHIYSVIDKSGGFYEGLVQHDYRSLMNITFGLKTAELEQRFLQEVQAAGFVGLKGHRELGHFRASAYNAVPEENCLALADFMLEFMRKNG